MPTGIGADEFEGEMNDTKPALQAYFLGTVNFAEMVLQQRRWVYEISGDPSKAVLVLCEHPPMLTLGREASRVQIRLTEAQLTARNWGFEYTARGGGLTLFAPGQVVAYLMMSTSDSGLKPAEYVTRLTACCHRLVESFGLAATVDAAKPGILVNQRRVLQIGVAIRHGVTGFGLVCNVNPDLELWQELDCDDDPRPMTSLQRECPIRIRPATVRQRCLEYLTAEFGFARVALLHRHPRLTSRPLPDAIIPHSPRGTRSQNFS
jgi:lipoyl(octanoyl) transferase